MQGLEEALAKPDVWGDVPRAQDMSRRLATLKDVVLPWRDVEAKAEELHGLVLLGQDEGDTSLEAEMRTEAEDLEARLEALESQLILSGEHDHRSAILAVHAGAGGTDSQDWAEMMLRMYLRWAERRGFEANILDISLGEEAGIKSATAEVVGPFAYGYLKSERGVHRLIRLSPFDFDHQRHTSFALVEVLPEVEGATEVEIAPDDLHIDVFGAGGAGGQNVQKNATAVRITHLPTGIMASCQNQRSLFQNRESAMKVLRARLMEHEVEQRAKEQARLKGKHVEAGWGNQIRSYVLHPYHMVKDHRTDHQTHDTGAVLDGDLDEFIEAYLRSTMGEDGGKRGT